MTELLDRYIALARELALDSGPWLAFNAVLATIPAVLAVILFHRPAHRGPAWWAGLGAFVLFLPNAPYVITELVHLRWMVAGYGDNGTEAVVPVIALAGLVLWGLASYAVALAELDRLMAREGWTRHRLLLRSGIHLLCAFGIVIGRISRVHSWHLLTRPGEAIDGIVSVVHPLALPLVVALAVAIALGASALTVLARAAVERSREVFDSARHRLGPALG